MLYAMKDFKNDKLAHLQACTCAPFAVFPAIYCILVFVGLFSNQTLSNYMYAISAMFWITGFVGYLIGVAVTALYGLPLCLFLLKRGKFKLSYVLLVSVIPAPVWVVATGDTIKALLLLIPCSLAVAFAYFYLYRWSASGIQQAH